MRYFYDLHLHSCLSPCGDMDMTPNNITGMASLLGLQIIALTDHNTCRNCGATIEAGKRNGVVVVPGMELTTSEDIHAVCLFPTLEKAMDWDEYVDAHRIKIKNRADIYGRQVLMNAEDEEIGEIEHLLLPGTEISIMNAYRKVQEFGGICYPAHIDRDSLSIMSVLGEIDPYCGFATAELADFAKLEQLRLVHPILDDLHIVSSSDAHYLENMRDAAFTLELNEPTAAEVIRVLDTPK